MDREQVREAVFEKVGDTFSEMLTTSDGVRAIHLNDRDLDLIKEAASAIAALLELPPVTRQEIRRRIKSAERTHEATGCSLRTAATTNLVAYLTAQGISVTDEPTPITEGRPTD